MSEIDELRNVMNDVTDALVDYQQSGSVKCFVRNLRRSQLEIDLIQRGLPAWLSRITAAACPTCWLPGITVREQ